MKKPSRKNIEYDDKARVLKVLKLMKVKKEPVVSKRKIDKKPKKLDV